MIKQFAFIKGHALGKRAPLRALANLASWQLRSRLRPGPIRCNWISDSVLMVTRGMTGATGNLYVGLHEFADMSFLLHMLRADDLFVDVGANIGSYTILASRVCGSRVIAFEPDPRTAANLATNLAANDVAARVDVRTMAVGAESGIATFSHGLDTVNHIIEGDASGQPTQRVQITTLDLALTGETPILMKIDVEGHEPSVIAGARAAIANPGFRAVILESFDPETFEILHNEGFRRHSYDPFTRSLSPMASEVCAGNSLFIRDEAFVAARLKNAPPIMALGQLF